jgi:hypothetical protein
MWPRHEGVHLGAAIARTREQTRRRRRAEEGEGRSGAASRTDAGLFLMDCGAGHDTTLIMEGPAVKPSRHIEARHILRSLCISTAAALALQIPAAGRAHAQASIECFKVCSNLFYKHVNDVMKCAYKGKDDEALGMQCAAKKAADMRQKYVVKLQPRCADLPCVTAYPSTNDQGCEELVFSTAFSAQVIFGGEAVPLDTLTRDRIIAAGIPGCGY